MKFVIVLLTRLFLVVCVFAPSICPSLASSCAIYLSIRTRALPNGFLSSPVSSSSSSPVPQFSASSQIEISRIPSYPGCPHNNQ